jgi:Carboxypeptidase regulatory-like domain/TonB-dependent Receptor Plug Domain
LLNPRKIFICLMLFAACAFGQDRGSVAGIVTDQSGGAVPGAHVTLANPATGVTLKFDSAGNGSYTFASLPAGIYLVTVEKQGFRKAEMTNVDVAVDTNTHVDVKLEVGQVQEVVQVQTKASQLQSDRSDLGVVIDKQAVADLPLFVSGGMRSNLAFAELAPGVRTDLSQDVDEGGSPVVGGGTGGSNTSFLIDGGEAASQRRNDPQMRVTSVEGIEEFKVQTGGYSAEYGHTSNGILNYTSKSGTNDFHGSLFAQIRNQALNADGFFYVAPLPSAQTVHNENDEAVSFGGPILIPKVVNLRNKAFFFFSGERSRAKDIVSSSLISVPTAAARQGNFTNYLGSNGQPIVIYNPFDGGTGAVDGLGNANSRNPFPGNIIPQSLINPVTTTLLSLEPLPVNPNSFINNNPIVNTGQRDPGENQGVYAIKGDYNPSEKLRINGLFSRQYFNGCQICLGPIPGPEGEGFQESFDNKYVGLNVDYVIRPTFLNQFSLQYYDRYGIEAANNNKLGSNTDAYGLATEIPGDTSYLRAPNFTSYDTSGNGFGNYNSFVQTHSPSLTKGLRESMTWIKGKNTIKYGFEFLRMSYERSDCNGCGGEIGVNSTATSNPSVSGSTGADLASLLLGLGNSGLFNFNGNINYVYPYYAWYFQDDIKVSRKLTLNLGLRYDLPLARREPSGQSSNFDAYIPNPGAGGLLGALIFAGHGPGRTGLSSILQHRNLAFGPRAGFAYLLTPKTVLRAGGAIFYNSNKEDGNADGGIQGFGGNFSAPANYFTSGVSIIFPNGSNGAVAGFNPFTSLIAAAAPPQVNPSLINYGSPSYFSDGRVGQYYDYNFTVERSITSTTLFRAAFHATDGNQVQSSQQFNQLNPKYIPIYGNLLTTALSSLVNANGVPTNPVLIANGFTLPYPAYPLTETLANALEPFPQYGSISGTTNGGHSTYNALEAQLQHSFNKGLFVQVSYTFSKWLSDNTSPNVYAENREKDLNSADRPNILAIAYIYQLPFGHGKQFGNTWNSALNGVLSGWKASVVQIYQSGAPFGVSCGQNLYGAGSARCSVNPGVPLVNPTWNPSNPNSSYINKAAFYQPANGVFGNLGAVVPGLRNPWQMNENVALSRMFNLGSERKTLEFRVSASNIANRHWLSGITTSETSSAFGEFTTSQAELPRNIEFSLRFKF